MHGAPDVPRIRAQVGPRLLLSTTKYYYYYYHHYYKACVLRSVRCLACLRGNTRRSTPAILPTLGLVAVCAGPYCQHIVQPESWAEVF